MMSERDSSVFKKSALIHSTAGAIPVRNEKGDFTMEKVKVKRYVYGKRPDYAPESSSDEEVESFQPRSRKGMLPQLTGLEDEDDARIRRLRAHQEDADDEDDGDVTERMARHRRIHEPEILEQEDEPEEEKDDDDERRHRHVVYRMEPEESSSEDEELDEEEIERRRALMRQKAKEKVKDREEEVLGVEEEGVVSDKEESEEESSEYEEYTSSEEESGPRLKPVFVAKKDRVTVQEKEIAAMKLKEQEEYAKVRADERRRETIKLVEKEAKKDFEPEESLTTDQLQIMSINTDDENEEDEYEAWKLREMKRIKRDRDEREQLEKDRQDIERNRNLTEDERRADQRINNKVITNKPTKGRYKFLQKYYHRGVFFMDKEEDVFKRDVSNPTLEDHFDKTVLPKVMQVKNFGRSGRTKYTHLVDQDTTKMDSPWTAENAITRKFQVSTAGGLKQSFDKPTRKKRTDNS
ncbi:microfibrillar-associated protein 1-like [Amphiura filiformis]|uniref:microfibrillar-associated protein 1-like n=1 Tax=Amphiura filiformis TaxID=82378 RepID=UPI003B222CE3